MSIPSASWATQIGVIASRALAVSRHERPAIDPLSSIKKTVSNEVRNAYRSSFIAVVVEGMVGATTGAGAEEGAAGEYAGGGSVAGVVNAFIPARSRNQSATLVSLRSNSHLGIESLIYDR